MEIKYVKMPISKEEKAKYHRQGFRVIDERFKPDDYAEPETGKADDKPDETAAERKARRAADRQAKKEAEQPNTGE